MATAAQAIERIAADTGILHATVFRAARALREADTNLWPQGSKGRGKGAHVEATHLINLALALAAASPITEVPEVVRTYRMLRHLARMPTSHLQEISGNLIEIRRNAPRPNMSSFARGLLGEDLDTLLTREVTEVGTKENNIKAYFHLELFTARQQARVYFEFPSKPDWHIVDVYVAKDSSRNLAPPGIIDRSARLTLGTIEVLANLLRDTLTRGKSTTNKIAASPGREAAISGDGSDDADRCAPEQPHPKEEREKSQSSSTSPVSHSLQQSRREHGGKPRKGRDHGTIA